MKAIRIMGTTVLAASAILAGCASNRPYDNGYNSGYNGYSSGYGNNPRAAYNGYGTIESIQVVQASAGTSGAGAVVGGLVGALAGNQIGSGGGRTAATVAGGVAGAAIGNSVERNRNEGGGQLYQINVRMDNGEYRTITQDSVYDLSVGNRVRVVDGRAYRY
ncbi:glycine zipper 2TM domain-containing protein [Massilia terrae]|uniref:Glycine zipper 2TM domain-containing protein n=1 Tax=Massilia terrae TaxID=1811224 RepID=A0ABT2D367_9BURK|nr:glycine zipper 2TM domain-containing protein [Massilia terrae]MCS0660216.1 glycine zipper 2TM domain-containing protein [Massilia terrae]